jgi:hypothetical protein
MRIWFSLTALILAFCLSLTGQAENWGEWIKAKGAGGVKYRWTKIERSGPNITGPYCLVELASADEKGHRVSAWVSYLGGVRCENFWGLSLGEKTVKVGFATDCHEVQSVSVDDIP